MDIRRQVHQGIREALIEVLNRTDLDTSLKRIADSLECIADEMKDSDDE